MAESRTVSAAPMRLSFRSTVDVMVEPENEDRFTMSMREAAFACKRAQDEKEFSEEFKQLLVRVHQWSEAHADKVRASYVGIGDGALNVFVCTKSKEFDFELDDQITELDLELVDQFSWLRGEILQIPAQVQEAQTLSQASFIVYGDGSRTS